MRTKGKRTAPPLVTRSQWERPLPSSLTWAFGEVVEAAVLGPHTALVAVACPVGTVHPPVRGQTAQVSASAAFPRTTPRHQVVLPQSGNHQQQTGKLHGGSHPEGGSGQTLEGKLYSLLVLAEYSLSGPTLHLPHSWPWEGEAGSPTQTRRPLPQEPLWPGILVSVSCVQPQKRVCRAVNSMKRPTPAPVRIPCLSYCVCVLSLRAGDSPLVPSWAPPSSWSHTGGDNEGKGGVRGFTSYFCSLSRSLSRLTCLIDVYPFSFLPFYGRFSVTLMPVSPGHSATPDLWVPKERQECVQLAGLQIIVPRGPLSIVDPPFLTSLVFSFSFRLL